VTHYMVMEGLEDMGLRKLAAVGGASDRMLIYYFGTKDGLIGEAMQRVAAGLSMQLDAVLGKEKRDAQTLLNELYALNGVPEFNLTIRLWFEVVGLAVRGREPYASSAAAIAQNWVSWVESRLIEEDVPKAKTLFAELEGRLMVSLIGVEF
ncbi:MAG: hypothetical protein AAGD96_26470, partial [Chloroflexota bacterium]